MAGIHCKKVNRWIPGFRFATGIGAETLSRDQAHLDSLEDLDLLAQVRDGSTYFEAANAAAEIVSQPVINYPVLLALGDADAVTSGKVAEDYFKRVRAPSKMLKIYPGFLHELHNETEREQVLADYVKWMGSILQTSARG